MNRARISERWHSARCYLATMLVVFLSACGGGGSGSNSAASDPTPTPTNPPALSRDQLIGASKFASRASFGLSFDRIETLARDGRESWLDRQFALPVGRHTPTVDQLVRRRDAGEFAALEEDIEYLAQFRRLAWWHCAVTCEDMLRQRVAFALSEIFVVSDNVDALIVYPYALSTYYDTLLANAFGNYRELLRDVALHPAMGVYLSHVNNAKSNPFANTFPDENFAREVMQLFSIGLFELNVDGSVQLGANDLPIPSYDNNDIREFAKIFTGFSYAGSGAFFGNPEPYFREPMQMFDAQHESGEKRLLKGATVPAGQTGVQDFDDAIDNLFNHPNVGPFIGKQLIQRLVTSNPSPAYIERVARAFNADASGVRGDLQAVIRAVLTDPEALAASNPAERFGKLREPVVRYLNILRLFGATSDDGFIANSGYVLQALSRQHPLSSPSVFNFFLPTYSPRGEIAAAELVAPELQIVDSSTVINMVNLLDFVLFGDFITDAPPPFAPVSLQFDELQTLAADVDELIERLDILLTYGTLSADSRAAIRGILIELPDTNLRARLAIYMFLMAADYVVEL